MAFHVRIASRAQRDLATLYLEKNAEHSEAAFKWYRGLRDAILSLESQPERCPFTPEDGRLRHLLFGKKPHVYRVIYRVLKKQSVVEVLHIRHGARRSPKATERG